jgi:uncharacterized membrane protein YjjB (DUF3815 family)
MIDFKNIPVRAVPFVVFLAGCATFGELYIRMPKHEHFQIAIAGAMAALTVASALCFFSKCFLNWPPMKGLDIPDY